MLFSNNFAFTAAPRRRHQGSSQVCPSFTPPRQLASAPSSGTSSSPHRGSHTLGDTLPRVACCSNKGLPRSVWGSRPEGMVPLLLAPPSSIICTHLFTQLWADAEAFAILHRSIYPSFHPSPTAREPVLVLSTLPTFYPTIC